MPLSWAARTSRQTPTIFAANNARSRNAFRTLLVIAIGAVVSACSPSSPGPSVPPRSTLPDDTNIQWSQADVLAIQTQNDPNSDAWNAGHINDIIKFRDPLGGMVVAADTGGVWAVTIRQQPVPLSGFWTSVEMSSLALGPDGTRDVSTPGRSTALNRQAASSGKLTHLLRHLCSLGIKSIRSRHAATFIRFSSSIG